MFGPWTAFIALAGTLLPLLWARRWTTRHLQLLAMRLFYDPDLALLLYYVAVMPGVIIHELSHWLMAKLLGVRTGRVQLMPQRGKTSGPRRRKITLGSVSVARTDPLRSTLIGVAPLLGGVTVILLIGNSVLGVNELMAGLGGEGGAGLWARLSELLHVPDFWLWLYLIFAVSNAMLPSDTDVAVMRPVLIFLGIAAVILLVIGGLPRVPPDITAGLAAVAGYLASAFGLTLVVDAFFMLLIGLAELMVIWIRRQ
jgi:hypothetical protein